MLHESLKPDGAVLGPECLGVDEATNQAATGAPDSSAALCIIEPQEPEPMIMIGGKPDEGEIAAILAVIRFCDALINAVMEQSSKIRGNMLTNVLQTHVLFMANMALLVADNLRVMLGREGECMGRLPFPDFPGDLDAATGAPGSSAARSDLPTSEERRIIEEAMRDIHFFVGEMDAWIRQLPGNTATNPYKEKLRIIVAVCNEGIESLEEWLATAERRKGEIRVGTPTSAIDETISAIPE